MAPPACGVKVAWKMPVATAGVVLGGLTLAGAPLTAGFAPHWQMYQALAEVDSFGLGLFVVGGLSVSLGYLRGLRAALSPDPSKPNRDNQTVFTMTEPLPLLLIIVGLGGICLLLGFFPALLIEPLQGLMGRLVLPVP